MHCLTPSCSHRVLPTTQPRILDVIPTGDSTERLVVQQHADPTGASLVLVQESFATDVGWFPQSRVVIQADQLAAFKALFSSRAVAKLVRDQVAIEAKECEVAVFAFPQAS